MSTVDDRPIIGDPPINPLTAEAVALVREDFNRLRGRLFETLESFGLAERQEKAAKAVVRRLAYDMQSSLESTIRRKVD